MKKKILNYIYLVPLLILSCISLFNMHNAKLISQAYDNALIKQLVWVILGFIIIFIINKLNIKKIFKYAPYFYITTITLLILVLLFGNNINGAKCWLTIFGISFQPSELVKISLLLMLIYIYNNQQIKSFKDEVILIIKYLIVTLIPIILVFLEPDTGAIINYLIIFFIVFIFSNLNKKWLYTIILTALFLIILFFIFYFFFQDILINTLGTTIFYRMDRIINFTNGNSYQLENSLITIGASSFFGVGFNKILLYIPEAPTDFIFSFSAGNFGISSAIIILLSYLFIIHFLLSKIQKTKDKNHKIFITSYTGMLSFHVIYNIGMNLGFFPIMGIPLPFLSYGGTNVLINFVFLGIITNIVNKEYQ